MKSVVSKKAFTIVELLVAMTLVVILVALSSLIFAAGIRAYRLADSTIEITRRAEAISRQLVADVGGLRTDAPLAIWFENAFVDTTGDGVADTYRRFDQILFFANGNFQTMRPYNGQTVSGNLSRIYYGHAWQVETDLNAAPTAFTAQYRQSGLLSRRAHLLTSNMTLTYPGIPNPFPNATNPTQFAATFITYNNNRSEYDQLSLAEWKNLMQDQDNCNRVLLTCFNNGTGVSDTGRPMIDMTNIETLHLLLSEQISEFIVQLGYAVDDLSSNAVTNEPIPPLSSDNFTGIRWWPSENPARDGTVVSDFVTMAGFFGAYFNLPSGTTYPDWYRVKPNPTEIPAQQSLWRSRTGSQSGTNYYFSSDYYPRALKFTFTVHDAKGLYPDGKTFTQIVMID